jgi:hypothetical protein
VLGMSGALQGEMMAPSPLTAVMEADNTKALRADKANAAALSLSFVGAEIGIWQPVVNKVRLRPKYLFIFAQNLCL